MKNIWIIRHGESEGNAGLRTGQAALIKLTERGHKQAELVTKVLPSSPDLIVTSPFIRTKETAAPYLKSLDDSIHEEWPVHEFSYLADCDNTTIFERRPLVKVYWERNDPSYIDGQGCESLNQFFQRIDNMWKRLLGTDAKTTVVFCHGNFIRGLLWTKLLKQSSDKMQAYHTFTNNIPVPNTAILRIDMERKMFSTLLVNHLPAEMVTL